MVKVRLKYTNNKWSRKSISLGQGRAGQPAKHTSHSLQLWFTRLALLVKLGQYDRCQLESEPFGSLTRPDVYFEVSDRLMKSEVPSPLCIIYRHI